DYYCQSSDGSLSAVF
nr:immunoglobulin light chain junction region [Macaca mulatta]